MNDHDPICEILDQGRVAVRGFLEHQPMSGGESGTLFLVLLSYYEEQYAMIFAKHYWCPENFTTSIIKSDFSSKNASLREWLLKDADIQSKQSLMDLIIQKNGQAFIGTKSGICLSHLNAGIIPILAILDKMLDKCIGRFEVLRDRYHAFLKECMITSRRSGGLQL